MRKANYSRVINWNARSVTASHTPVRDRDSCSFACLRSEGCVVPAAVYQCLLASDWADVVQCWVLCKIACYSLMGGFLHAAKAADRPQRRIPAFRRVFFKIRHTGTDGIRKYRSQHCLLESQRGYVSIYNLNYSRELFMSGSRAPWRKRYEFVLDICLPCDL